MDKRLNHWIKGKKGAWIFGIVILLLLLLTLSGQFFELWDIGELQGTAGLPQPSYAPPDGGVTCLPTCSENDGKFLALVNDKMASFAGEKIIVWISVPGDTASFEFSIFDGDSGKDNNNNVNRFGGNWDTMENEVIYTLYADPLKNGLGTSQIGQWFGNRDMINNGWYTINQPNVVEAKGPSGHFYYRLEAAMQEVGILGINAFKLRSSGFLSAGQSDIGTGIAGRQNYSLGIVGMLANPNDASIIYPHLVDYSNPGESTYTGDWQFQFYIPNETSKLEIWDGDFDRGSSDGTAIDTDDPNTEGKPFWAQNNPYVLDERGGGRGAPADDYNVPFYRREPPVRYEFIDPIGQPVYINEEPSGTEEWERFVVSTDPSTNPDLLTDQIKAGYYTFHIQGLDLYNTVWIRLDYEIVDQPPPPVWPEGTCPRTIGYWKNNVSKVLINNKKNGVQESRETLEWGLNNVALASPLFRTGLNVTAPFANEGTTARLTDQEAEMILQRSKKNYPGDANTMLARALQQNLAAWLNLGTGKLGPTTVVHLEVPSGAFDGTVWEALQEAQNIILYGGDLERAKDIADLLNNGELNTDPGDTKACESYTNIIPPDKQPPSHDDMPKAPKPTEPPAPVPEPEPDPNTCNARVNNYGVENPTNNPFYGIKFEFQSGTEVRDGDYDEFTVVLPADVVAGMTAVNMEAKAATNQSMVVLEGCDFTSPLPCGEPVRDENNWFAFYFMGATDNGDGTLTLKFQVQNFVPHGLSHATIGLPEGVVPPAGGSYQSMVCP